MFNIVDASLEMNKSKDNKSLKSKPLKQQLCTIMEQSSRTTGSIGDVNNDQKLDLVLTFNAQGLVKDMNKNYIDTETSLDVIILEMEKNYGNYPLLHINAGTIKPSLKNTSPIKFKPLYQQVWTGYMGHNTLSSHTADIN